MNLKVNKKTNNNNSLQPDVRGQTARPDRWASNSGHEKSIAGWIVCAPFPQSLAPSEDKSTSDGCTNYRLKKASWLMMQVEHSRAFAAHWFGLGAEKK